MECLIRGSRCGAEAGLGSFNTGLEDDVVAERSFTSTRAWMAFSTTDDITHGVLHGRPAESLNADPRRRPYL